MPGSGTTKPALLIHCARSVLFALWGKPDRISCWLRELVARQSYKRTAVALAAKNALIIWALLIRGEDYQVQVAQQATVARLASRQIDGLKDWALKVQGRTNYNKAACALANKLARICYAVLSIMSPMAL